MTAFTLKIRGTKELQRAFESLPGRVQKQVARKALRPGAATMSRGLKKAVPVIPTEQAADLIDRHLEDVTTGVWDDEARYRLYWLQKMGTEAQVARFVERTDAKIGRAITRHIRNSIGRRKKTYTNTGVVMEAVGVRYDYRNPPVGISAGRLAERVEFGDEEIPARPFFRAGLTQSAGPALTSMLGKAKDVVREEAAKLAGAGGGAG